MDSRDQRNYKKRESDGVVVMKQIIRDNSSSRGTCAKTNEVYDEQIYGARLAAHTRRRDCHDSGGGNSEKCERPADLSARSTLPTSRVILNEASHMHRQRVRLSGHRG